MEFDKLKILDGNFWDVFLHQDQTALGRLYFWYKKGETNDLLDAPKEALTEFYDLAGRIKSALAAAFQPDLYNYLSLNNVTSHLHVHLIPRYSKEIELFGLVFDDNSFGKDYQRNSDFVVNEEILIKIKEKIKDNLK
ncbi:MAG: HIT family protein [Candidatus Buchananbacteria bacterium]